MTDISKLGTPLTQEEQEAITGGESERATCKTNAPGVPCESPWWENRRYETGIEPGWYVECCKY